MNPVEQPKPVPVVNRRQFLHLSALTAAGVGIAAALGQPSPVEAAPVLEAASEKIPLTTDRVNELITEWHTAGVDLGHAASNPAEHAWNQQPALEYFEYHDPEQADSPSDIFSETGAHKVSYSVDLASKTVNFLTYEDQAISIAIPEDTETVDIIGLLDVAEATFDERTQSLTSWVKEWTGSDDLTHIVIGSFEAGPEDTALFDKPFVDNDEVARNAAIVSAAGRHVNSTGKANLGTTIMVADKLPMNAYPGVDVVDQPVITDGAIIIAPGKVDVQLVQQHLNSLGVSENNTPTEESIVVEADSTGLSYSTAAGIGNINNGSLWEYILPAFSAMDDGENIVKVENANGTNTVTVGKETILVFVTADSTVVKGAKRLDDPKKKDGRAVYEASEGKFTIAGTLGGVKFYQPKE